MNFFGHAWVGAWFSERAPFLLGAMLPDLANALGSASPRPEHPELAAGVRLHHETDRAFHVTEAFQRLEQGARRVLGAVGVSKGPRRALAHVGVEFLIDDELGRHAPAWRGYDAALRFGASSAGRSALRWSNTGDGERFGDLCQRLAAASPLVRLGDDRRLAARLSACLAGRPRLALKPEEEAALEPWLAGCRPAVAASTPALLAELVRALDAPPAARDALAALASSRFSSS